jgi:LysM repeat protein
MLDLFSRWQRRMLPVLGIVLTGLVLTGCYQQAAEPFESVDGTDSVAAAATNTEVPLFVEMTATPFGGESTAVTDEEPDVMPTVIEAGDILILTEEPPEAATQDTGGLLVFTVAPSDTPAITPTEQAIVETEPDDAEATNEGEGFVTPGAPPDPVVISTRTPIPGSQPVESTALPGSTDSGPVGTPTPTIEVSEDCIYTVRYGDTLYRIAIANSVFLRDLRAVNPAVANTDVIFPGQRLIIPGCESDDETGTGTAQPTATATETVQAGMTIHTVQAGETLVTIARRYSLTVQQIVDANPTLSNPNRLSIGQRLNIPTSGS